MIAHIRIVVTGEKKSVSNLEDLDQKSLETWKKKSKVKPEDQENETEKRRGMKGQRSKETNG